MTETDNPQRQPSRRWASIAGLILALLVPALLSAHGSDAEAAVARPAVEVLVSEACIWAVTLSLLAIVLYWERRPLASIGLVRPRWPAFAAGAAATLGLLGLAVLAALAIQQTGLPLESGREDVVIGLPPWVQLAIVVSAGFTEEILYRGYPIERLTELTGSCWLGAAIPVVMFGAAHAPFWGIGHALVAGLSGLWLTLLYLWRRNLWTNITAHALLDGLVFVLVDFSPAADGTTT